MNTDPSPRFSMRGLIQKETGYAHPVNAAAVRYEPVEKKPYKRKAKVELVNDTPEKRDGELARTKRKYVKKEIDEGELPHETTIKNNNLLVTTGNRAWFNLKS